MDKVSTKLILSVIDAYRGTATQDLRRLGKKGALKKTIRLARNNGLYYYLLLGLQNHKVSPSEVNGLLAEETRHLEDFKHTIELLNKASAESGVGYILIKSCMPVPHIPRDVDILVLPTSKKMFQEALERDGMTPVHSNVVETSLAKPGHLKVDIYTEITYFGVNFIDNEQLWNFRIQDEIFGIKYPGLNREMNYLLDAVHTIFGHREITMLDLLHFMSLQEGLNLEFCSAQAGQKGWGGIFELFVETTGSLQERLFERHEAIEFPYLFGQRYIFKCISMVKGLRLSPSARISMSLSLLIDKLFHELKKTPMYTYGTSDHRLVRKMLNSVAYVVRGWAGDKKSSETR